MTSTFLVVTKPLPTAERATIPHLSEEMQGFHMNPNARIFLAICLFLDLSSSNYAFPGTTYLIYIYIYVCVCMCVLCLVF